MLHEQLADACPRNAEELQEEADDALQRQLFGYFDADADILHAREQPFEQALEQVTSDVVEELRKALADASEEVVRELQRRVDNVPEDLLHLGNDGPEGGRWNAQDRQQPFDDEFDGIVEELAKGVREAPPQSAGFLAQLLDLRAGFLNRVAGVLDQLLVEVGPRLFGVVMETVELLAEALLLLVRPRLEAVGQISGQGVVDLVACALDDLVGRADHQVDILRDAGDQVADVIAVLLLCSVVGPGDPARQACGGVPARDEESADARVTILDLVLDHLQVALEPVRDDREVRRPLPHRRVVHALQQILDPRLRVAVDRLCGRGKLRAQAFFAAFEVRLLGLHAADMAGARRLE